MRPNQTKRLLDAGKSALGSFSLCSSPLLGEVLGHAGFDFVIVDLQHGESNTGNLVHMLQAVSCTPATPVVRVTSNQPADIQRALDMGAYGVVVPMVNTRAQAEAILASVHYAPRGVRSWGPLRGLLYGGGDYTEKASQELLVIAMLETAEAVRNAKDILAVPGIDGCFIGPSDLSIALGCPSGAPPYAQPVEDAILAIRDAAVAAGKAPGIYTPSTADAKTRLGQGFRFVCVENEFSMVYGAAVAAVKALRA